MRRIVLFLFVFGLCQMGFAQNKKKDPLMRIITHQVQLGETVRLLSKKYLADPSEIYRINKFAVNGISEGMVLKIPVPIKDEPFAVASNPDAIESTATASAEAPQKTEVTVIDRRNQSEHIVQSGETLSGLSRKYGISIDEIKLSNESLQTKGLKIGQVIKIPSTRVLADNESSLGSDEVPTSQIATASKTKNKK